MDTRLIRKFSRIADISFAIVIAILLGILAFSTRVKAAANQDIQWDQVLLDPNWADRVIRMPTNAETTATSAPYRIIRGHALLTRNLNNESLCLFLSASSPEDHEAWEQWTRVFAGKYPTSALARYFRGDALARLQDLDHAIDEFTTGLSFEPDNALILSARGVVHTIRRHWDAALMDFALANKAAGNFADAYANQGFMWIQKQDGAPGALKAFKHAIDTSEDFALAFYGRGCVLAVLGEWKSSAQDLQNAVAKSSCSGELIGSQLTAMFEKIAAKEIDWLQTTDGKKPGTEIERKFMNNMRAIKEGSFGGWNGPLNQNIKLMRDNPHLMGVWKRETQSLSPIVNQALRATMTVRGRDVNGWWSQIKDVKASVTGNIDMKGLKANLNGGIKQYDIGLKGKIESGTTNWANHNLKSGDAPTWNKARQLLPPARTTGCPGGFASAPVQAAWDNGEWPFEAQYGLLYGMQPHPAGSGQ